MARLMADCRRFPSESNCSLVMIGEEEEMARAAAEHAASVHGHEDGQELRRQIREFLEPAEAYEAVRATAWNIGRLVRARCWGLGEKASCGVAFSPSLLAAPRQSTHTSPRGE